MSDDREWRCFHCDEVFASIEAAREHFGDSECETPACKLNATEGGLLKLYREAQAELHTFRVEDNASYREFYALGADHFQALRREEEKGYARGLLAGRALAKSFSLPLRLWWFLYWTFTGKAHPDHLEFSRYVKP